MIKAYRLCALLLALILTISLCSCENAELSDATIICQVQDGLSTLDPQLVQTTAEMSAVVNCFDGLLRLDENGELTNGAAASYQLSDNKLTYTFTLREGMYWSDDTTPVTAADFVFGMQRALAPETKAPYASLLYSVKNAERVHSGAAALSSLGVTAPDEKTVVITLEKADYSLLSSLAHPVAMPCNKAFFEQTNGKYGLNRKSVISNGAFYLTKWNTEDEYIKLGRFDKYNGEQRAIPAAVSLAFNKQNDLIYTNLSNDSIDIGALSPIRAAALGREGYSSSTFYNTSYVLYLSPDINGELRQALCYDIDKPTLSLNLPEYCKTDCSIVPLSAVEGQENYRELTGELTAPEYDKAAAVSLYSRLDDDEASGLVLYYPAGDEDIKLTASLIAQTWQRELNAFINISEYDSASAIDDIKGGEMQLAILPVSGFGGTAYNSLINFKGLGLGNFDSRIQRSTDDVSSFCNYMKSGEQYLVERNYVYPLFNLPIFYSESVDITGVTFSSSGKYIDFKYTRKSD